MLTLAQSVVGAAHQLSRHASTAALCRELPFSVGAMLLGQPGEAMDILRSGYSQLSHPGKRLLVPIFSALACQRLVHRADWLAGFVQEMVGDQLSLYRERDVGDDGLPCLWYPTESLLPQAPYWESMEQADGRWAVQEPLFLALLTWANESLLYLLQLTKGQSVELAEWQELTVYSMNELLWDTEYGIYLPRDLTCGDTVLSGSLGGVVPLVAEIASQDQAEAMRSILQANFLEDTHYFFPTTSVFNQDMQPAGVDAGALDPVLNWLLFFGLLRYDFDDLAIHLRNNMLDLVGEYGFYRYYESERRSLGNRGIGTGRCIATASLFAHLMQAPLQHPFYRLG